VAPAAAGVPPGVLRAAVVPPEVLGATVDIAGVAIVGMLEEVEVR
jgi:hypothetical protein